MNLIKKQTEIALKEIFEKINLNNNDIFIVGCSSSEVLGKKIGTSSSLDIAKVIFEIIHYYTNKNNIFLAAQCCEHLNRAIVVEKECAEIYKMETVNAVPQVNAGGSFAFHAYNSFNYPVLVEEVKANAGIDIGNTFIGMHLKKVAVPIRLAINKIGEANLSCAKTRPKFIGGNRTIYNENIM